MDYPVKSARSIEAIIINTKMATITRETFLFIINFFLHTIAVVLDHQKYTADKSSSRADAQFVSMRVNHPQRNDMQYRNH